MPFATKHNKRIKIQGSLETLGHQTLYWLPPTHTLGRSIFLNDLKKKRKENAINNKRRGAESSQFVKLREKLVFLEKTLYTVVPLQAWAVPSLCQIDVYVLDAGTIVPTQAHAVPSFWQMALKKILLFSNLMRTITYKKKLKATKTNKVNEIKLAGCLPRSTRLKSLA